MAKPIGVFDSGIGGLTVVREIMRLMPEEQIIYFGDTARVPYGNKSNATIRKFANEIVQFLLSKNVKAIVVACNSVSSTALNWLKPKYSLPLIGVIEPGAAEAVKITKNQRIGIIGTRATIASRAYEFAIHRINPEIQTYSKSCPLLVPLAEEGWFDPKVIEFVLKPYLSELKKKDIDTLILGCTHYPLLKQEIQKYVGPKIKLIDSATAVAFKIYDTLKAGQQEKKKHSPVIKSNDLHVQFYFSDVPRGFNQLSKRFIGHPIPYKKITLE